MHATSISNMFYITSCPSHQASQSVSQAKSFLNVSDAQGTLQASDGSTSSIVKEGIHGIDSKAMLKHGNSLSYSLDIAGGGTFVNEAEQLFGKGNTKSTLELFISSAHSSSCILDHNAE